MAPKGLEKNIKNKDMPLPKTTNIGTIIKELNQSSTKRPYKQKVAIVLAQARKSGANIPKKKSPIAKEVAKRGMHKMPGGHIMKNSEMKKMMS